MTRGDQAILFFIVAWCFLAWSEHQQHTACIETGGTVVLGWFQDGCSDRMSAK